MSRRSAADRLSWKQFDIGLLRNDGSAHASALRLFSEVAPLLHKGYPRGSAYGWFFMRKPPDVRLRLLSPLGNGGIVDSVKAALQKLLVETAIDSWRPGLYRPERDRFGGPAALEAVHAYFCLDTLLWLATDPLTGPTERQLDAETSATSVFQHLFESVGAEHDAGAAWHELAALTGADGLPAAPVSGLPPIALDVLASDRSLRPVERAVLGAYRQANEMLADKLVDLAGQGQLGRTPPAVAATVALFNLNRHGIPGHRSAPLVRRVLAACKSCQ